MNGLKITMLFALALAFVACDSSEVQMVKGGTLQSCPDKTVEQMVNGYMGNPEWRSLVAEDGNDYVNVVGEISYNNQPTKAEIQFRLNKEKSSFQFHAWELGGKPAPDFVAAVLLEKMCYADLEKLAKEAAETIYESYELQKKDSENPAIKNKMEKMVKQIDALSEEHRKIVDGYLEEIVKNDSRMTQMYAEQNARREASVIGPAMGTFKKLLEAYFVEGNGLGIWRSIGYQPTKSSNLVFREISVPDKNTGVTLAAEGIQAINLNDFAGCPARSSWTMLCKAGENYSIKCDCSIQSDNRDACVKITPNFMNLCR